MSIRDFLKVVLGIFTTFVLFFYIVGPFMHESGHALMAMVLGVHFNELVFGFYGLGPGVTVPNYVSKEFLVYFRYAGGFLAASVFLISYIIFTIWQRYAFSQPCWWSKFRWWFGYILLVMFTFNLIQGYFEGAHFDRYVTGELPSAFHILITFFSPMIVHLVLTLLLSKRQRLKLI